MNKFYALLAMIFSGTFAFAQCQVQIQHTNVLCFGQCNGTATAFGTSPGPFTYQWSTTPVQTTQTATGLCAGTYTVLVVNGNNCTGTQSVTITQPQQLQCATTSNPNTSCGNCNGLVVATAFGGTQPYIYTWQPGNGTGTTMTGLCAGTYTFTVTDANGCTCTSVATVANSTPTIQTSSTGQNPSCSNCNGSVTASAQGGQAPYTFSWAPSGCNTSTCTGLCAGTYTCYITDANGCTATTVHTLTAGGNLVVTCTGQNSSSCTSCNGMTIASASGGTQPYTYSWMPSGCTTQTCTGLCGGTYTCIATDANGCTGMSTWTLTNFQSPQFSISGTNATGPNCNNGTLTATPSGPGSYTYSWNTSPPQTTQTATGLSAGVYTCCVTNTQNGCTSCQPGTVACVTGIADNNSNAVVNVYPNPASQFLTIDYFSANDGSVKVEIVNIVGERVYAAQLSGKQFIRQVDVSGLPRGIYLLRLNNSSGSLTKKLIIE